MLTGEEVRMSDKKELREENQQPASVTKEALIDVNVEEEAETAPAPEEMETVETASVEELDTAPLAKAREWLKNNQENLKHLSQAKIRSLETIIDSPDTLTAASLAEASQTLEELEKELKEKFNRQFNNIKSGLVNLREEMFQIPGYDNLPDDLQEVALNTFTNCEIRLSNTNSIDELKSIFDNFENNVYPDLAGKIYALENPNVFPLNLVEVLYSMPRLTFSTEEELDSALAQVREEAIKKLNKSKPKQ